MPDKKKLPEISVSSGPIVQHAREMADIRAKIAVLKTQEETACQKIKAAAEPMRQARIDGDDDPRFVGMIRIVANGLTPVRCEFKLTKNTALELTEEKRLTEMYGASRPLLFGRKVRLRFLPSAPKLGDCMGSVRPSIALYCDTCGQTVQRIPIDIPLSDYEKEKQ